VGCVWRGEYTAAGDVAKGSRTNISRSQTVTALTTVGCTIGWVECKPANDLHHNLCTFSVKVMLLLLHTHAHQPAVEQLAVHLHIIPDRMM